MSTLGVPNTVPLVPFSREALQNKMKYGNVLELPGVLYNQYTPTAANCNTGSTAASLIGQNQKGIIASGTTPLGGTTTVTFSSSSGLLATLSAASWLPTTLNYNDFPVIFSPASGATLPTGIIAGQLYYWQWVSSTTGRLALTPGGTVIPYTNAGSGTIYMQASSQYWGNANLPAGFFQAADTLYQAPANSLTTPGTRIKGEIWGTITSAGTGTIAFDFGLLNSAGTFTSLSDGGTATALTAVGPFPFWYNFEFVVQQYGQSSIASPYVAAGVVRSVGSLRKGITAASELLINNAATKTVIDLTQAWTIEARATLGTPATGTYIEPLSVKITVDN